MREVSSWGGITRPAHTWVQPSGRRELVTAMGEHDGPGLAYGNGRSYGDVCLNGGGVLWSMRGLDRFIEFDRASGEIECEAGTLLSEVISLALPSGWFVPVTPGTAFVTLGGAVANDVHGKNHHRAGTFAEHVQSLDLRRTDGTLLRCSRDQNAAWFAATAGGLGLTGVIESMRLRLRRVTGPWIDAESEPFDSLEAFLALSAGAAERWEYTVAWVDCGPGGGQRGRGVFFRGNHADDARPAPPSARRAWPIELPMSLVNSTSVRAFNALYRLRHGRKARFKQGCLPFFYPLDGVANWNRVYGRRGFHQYQCVVPVAFQLDAVREILTAVGRHGAGSFLAVLKTFDARAPVGLLSFPMAGTTLAVDVPHRGADTLRLLERLDAIVAAAGGRLYAAKDARLPAALFRSGYPRASEFERFRDPGIASDMSRRLFGS